jgi:hypothetical protein
MNKFQLTIQSFYDLPKKSAKNGIKKYHLSYNNWININKFVRNNIKKGYEEYITKLLDNINAKQYKFKKIKITYEVYFKSKTGDLMNLVSIIDKMTLDAIVDYGIIEDDKHMIVPEYYIKFCGYDKEKKGYMIITIEEIN